MSKFTTPKVNPEHAKKVLALIKEYPEPIKEYCPIIIQRLKRKDGEHLVVIQHDEEVINYCDANLNVVAKGDKRTPTKEYTAFYGLFHEKYGCYEIANIYMNGKTAHVGDVRKWSYDFRSRVFWFYGDPIIYEENGAQFRPDKQGIYYNKGFLEYLQILGSCKIIGGDVHSFTKFLAGTKRPNRYVTEVGYPWQIKEYYKAQMPRNIGKKGQTFQSLMTIGLPNEPTPSIPSLIFTQINEDWICGRLYKSRNSWEPHHDKSNTKEYYRIYINKKKEIFVHQLHDDRLINKISMVYDNCNLLTVIYRNDCKKILEKMFPGYELIANQKEFLSNPIKTLMAISKYPVIEKLIKEGYHNIATLSIKDGNIPSWLKDHFNATIHKTQPLTKQFNMSKNALKAIDNIPILSYLRSAIAMFKEVYGEEGMNTYDEKKVENILRSMIKIHNRFYNDWRNIDGMTPSRYDCITHSYNTRTSTYKETIKTLVIREEREEGYIPVFLDIMRMIQNNPEIPNLPQLHEILSIKDIGELSQLHNHLINFIKEVKDAALQKAWEERMPIWKKKYEYEGDNYLITYPKEPSEVTKEGMALSHCVGSYAQRVGMGETDILFLRTKVDPQTPYFTIEVTNGEVMQIHGHHNAWLGTAPTEAIKFVIKWLREKKISCTNKILLNQSYGYCASSEMLNPKDFGLEGGL